MAKTRVHELAKEFGVESRWVLERFKEMGEFVKSASSPVELQAEMRFRKEYGASIGEGGAPAVEEAKDRASHAGRQLGTWKPLSRAERDALKPPRQTSWTLSQFDAVSEEIWRRAGLGDNDAGLAMYLLEHGVFPEDLRLMLRGRRASARLREGLESRTVLVQEILEARSKPPVKQRELPSTKVVRRSKEAG